MIREDIEKIAEEWLEKWVATLKWDTPHSAKISLAKIIEEQCVKENAGLERVLQHRTDICNDAIRVSNDYAKRLEDSEPYREGVKDAIKICELRAQAERIYNDAGKGESHAAYYDRAVEDIKALLKSKEK